MLAREGQCLRGGMLRIGQVEGDEAAGIRVLERAGTLGGDGEVDAQAARGLYERGRAVGRRGEEEEEPASGGRSMLRPYFLAAAKYGFEPAV